MPGIFAIGDIHGCYKTFKKLLFEKISIRLTDEIYCIGDYVDRGKNSKEVIDLIIELRKKGYRIHTIRGNHEQMMLDSSRSKQNLDLWLRNGGKETLLSFGVSSIDQLPERYFTFLNQTSYYITTGKYIFVHAGLNFEIEDPFSDKSAMLWSRDTYFDNSKIDNRILIHGHTPNSLYGLLNQADPYKINTDAGCVYKDIPGLGNLAAVSFPDKKWVWMNNID